MVGTETDGHSFDGRCFVEIRSAINAMFPHTTRTCESLKLTSPLRVQLVRPAYLLIRACCYHTPETRVSESYWNASALDNIQVTKGGNLSHVKSYLYICGCV